LLARCVGPGAPPRLARVLSDAPSATSCAELLAELSDPLLLARQAEVTASPGAAAPSGTATAALATAYGLAAVGAAASLVPLALAGALAAAGAFLAGQRRHACFALALSALAALSGWLAPG